MDSENVTSFYAKDHDQLDTYFKNFQKLKKTKYPEAKENFKKFKFGLQRHIVWEEEILFPVFEQKSGMVDAGPTVVMRQEHREIGRALEDLHRKVQQNDPKSDLEEQALLLILGDHNMKEENILYPTIDQMITNEENAQIFNQMKNLPEERYKTCCHGH